MPEKKVMLYTLSTCSHCKTTKKFFDECTVQYTFTDVDMLTGEERQAVIEDIKKINPRCSFPTILIGDTVIVGFNQSKIEKALEAL